jgi:O-antigen ligase
MIKQKNTQELQVKKYFNYLALFMAFPMILILGFNLSLFLFALILYFAPNKELLFNFRNKFFLLPVLFIFGAFISVFDVNVNEPNAFMLSASVLPNYIYWALLIVVLGNSYKLINLSVLTDYLFKGLVFLIVYYQVQGPIREVFPLIFNNSTPNNFAFILICFCPPVVVYLWKIKRNSPWAISFLAIVIIILIIEGRRAGTILTLIPCLLALVLTKINSIKVFLGIITALFITILIGTSFVEEIIQQSNPRIYELIYLRDKIQTEDQSYLVRRIQIEKGLIIFSNNPITGIGLNTFAKYELDAVGDFEGSELVTKKENITRKSAHNSYISILAEGGLLLFIPFMGILLFNIVHFIKQYNDRSQIENAFYWAYLAMLIHFYFITAIVNVYAWFLIGIVSMISIKYLKNQGIKNKI